MKRKKMILCLMSVHIQILDELDHLEAEKNVL